MPFDRQGGTAGAAPHLLGKLNAEPRWSPSGRSLYYGNETGRSILLDPSGREQGLPFNAGATPGWSADEQYLAYLDGKALWIAPLSGPARRIADGIDSFAWAPAGLLLAYDTVSTVGQPQMAPQPEGRTTWVYDAASSVKTQVAAQGGLAGWAPDGQGVEIIRITGVGNSIFWMSLAGSLDGKRLIEVEPGSTDAPAAGYPGRDAWVIGSKEILPGLSGVRQFLTSGRPIDWTPDGRQALVLEGEWLGNARRLYYFDRALGRQRLLYTQSGGIAHASAPGVWAEISPRGTWALVQTVDRDERLTVMLMRTDVSSQRRLGDVAQRPQNYSDMRLLQLGSEPFSPDERWLINKDPRDGCSTISAAAVMRCLRLRAARCPSGYQGKDLDGRDRLGPG